MPFGANAPFTSYSAVGGLCMLNIRAVPDWVIDAIEQSASSSDFDKRMAEAGAVCIENYGSAVEALDVWRLTPEGGSWFVVHWDGDQVDMFVFLQDIIDYATFQARWLAPMAQKIMAEEQYFAWRQAREEAARDQPSIH